MAEPERPRVSTAPELWVLGAGSSLPRAGYGCSGYALALPDGTLVLLDAGPGTVRGLGAFGGTLDRLRGLLLTHEHADHCADLAHLFFARRNPSLAPPPELEIVGPTGTADLVRRTQAWLGRTDESGSPVAPEGVRVRELDAGARGRAELCGVLVEHAPTGHTANAQCYRLTLPGGYVLCYSGDSGECESLVDLARGADLFLVECSAPDEAPLEQHLYPAAVTRIVRRAAPRGVLLTHFYPQLEPDEALRRVRAGLADGRPGDAPAPWVAAARDGLGLTLDPGHFAGWTPAARPRY